MSSRNRDPTQQVGKAVAGKGSTVSSFQAKFSSWNKPGTNTKHVKIVYRKRDGAPKVKDKGQLLPGLP